MKKRYILILSIVLAILSVSVVSAGLFDGLIGGKEAHDNVIEIENITFNTTNVTKFKFINDTTVGAGHNRYYLDENKTGHNVWIINDSEDDTIWNNDVLYMKNYQYNNVPSQTVDGVVVYTTSAVTGNHVGEPRYEAYVENYDLKTIVIFSTPNPNETAKMALSLKFK